MAGPFFQGYLERALLRKQSTSGSSSPSPGATAGGWIRLVACADAAAAGASERQPEQGPPPPSASSAAAAPLDGGQVLVGSTSTGRGDWGGDQMGWRNTYGAAEGCLWSGPEHWDGAAAQSISDGGSRAARAAAGIDLSRLESDARPTLSAGDVRPAVANG